MFDAKAKTLLLDTDQTIQMGTAVHNATSFANIFSGRPVSPYIDITVSRDNLVQDTISEIMHHSKGDLKKPLRVKFQGEEAEDAGMFFHLLSAGVRFSSKLNLEFLYSISQAAFEKNFSCYY